MRRITLAVVTFIAVGWLAASCRMGELFAQAPKTESPGDGGNQTPG